MSNKFISEYTNETNPSSTDELLIDQGSGAYKAVTVAALFGRLATSADPFYIGSESVDGSIRIFVDGTAIMLGLRASGVWTDAPLLDFGG